MRNEQKAEQHRIAKKILSYLESHPYAADSAKGIAGWWVKQPLHLVLPALELLVGHEMMERLESGDGHVYRSARRAIKSRRDQGLMLKTT